MAENSEAPSAMTAPAQMPSEPFFLNVGDRFELCRFPTSGEWSLREKQSDGDVLHLKYLCGLEIAIAESFLARAESLQTEVEMLRDALDMATQGKYSQLMLDLANGVSEQRADRFARLDAEHKLAEAVAALSQFRRIGWAQEMGVVSRSRGKYLLMETTLPKENLHDNGRPMLPLFVQDEATK